jgi:hypothetical protein
VTFQPTHTSVHRPWSSSSSSSSFPADRQRSRSACLHHLDVIYRTARAKRTESSRPTPLPIDPSRLVKNPGSSSAVFGLILVPRSGSVPLLSSLRASSFALAKPTQLQRTRSSSYLSIAAAAYPINDDVTQTNINAANDCGGSGSDDAAVQQQQRRRRLYTTEAGVSESRAAFITRC